MKAQLIQAFALLAAMFGTLEVRSALLFRSLLILCLVWIVVGPSIAAVLGRRRRNGESHGTAVLSAQVVAGIVLNVVVWLAVLFLVSGVAGISGMGP